MAKESKLKGGAKLRPHRRRHGISHHHTRWRCSQASGVENKRQCGSNSRKQVSFVWILLERQQLFKGYAGGQVYTGRRRIPKQTTEGIFAVSGVNMAGSFCLFWKSRAQVGTSPRVLVSNIPTQGHTRDRDVLKRTYALLRTQQACIDASKFNLMR